MGIWHNPRLLAIIANGLIGFALVVFLAVAGGWLISQPYFELRHVQLGAAPGSALRHVNKDVLVETVRQAPSGNFFTVDMTAIKEVVQQVPWVRQATVRRLWPDTLVVMIEEHRAAALWEDSRLVSVYGELFSANLDEAVEDGPLPQLGGPDGTEAEVMSRYQEIQRVVEPLGLMPVAVNLSPRLAWTATLDDGTELMIGKDRGVPIAERIASWVESYPLVTERMQRLASVIDFRYPNGYAVRSLELLADALTEEALAEEVQHAGTPVAVMAGLKSAGQSEPVRPAPARAEKAPVRQAKAAEPTAAKPRVRSKPTKSASKKSRPKPKAKAKTKSTVKRTVKPKARKRAPVRKVKRQVKPAAVARRETPAKSIEQIRREATRKAAARHAARAREAARARLKAKARDKRSAVDFQPAASALARSAFAVGQSRRINPTHHFNPYWTNA